LLAVAVVPVLDTGAANATPVSCGATVSAGTTLQPT
jgi:hypothetical protein